MFKENLILIGGGGHCKACIDVIEHTGKYRIAGIVDVPNRLHEKVLGYNIIASDDQLERLVTEYQNFFIAIGQIKSSNKRIHFFNLLKQAKAKLPIIISPYAHVSRHARIGAGTIVMHQALINAGAIVGRNCIVNSKALVEHDVVIGDNCHISTAVTINGGAQVLSGTFIGSHSVCKEMTVIKKNTIVPYGSIL